MAGRTDAQKLTVDGQRVFSGLTKTVIGLWTKDDQKWVAPSFSNGTWYEIQSTVGDTTSVEQAENEINAIESEYTSDPLFEKETAGKKTFSCELINFQKEILADIFGWEAGSKSMFAPTNAKTIYATIELHFESSDDIVVLPKVRLNSTMTLASLKTDAGKVTISGTCYSTEVNDGTKNFTTDMVVVEEGGDYAFGAVSPTGE